MLKETRACDTVSDEACACCCAHSQRPIHCLDCEHPSLTKACICAGYEEEEEEYGYPGHMRQASLELNVAEAASPRGNNGKLPYQGPTQCRHALICTCLNALLHLA